MSWIRMRSLPLFSFAIILFSLSFCLIIPNGHTNSFSHTITYYQVSGEMCYDYFTNIFVGTYSIKGQMRVELIPYGPETVEFVSWHYLINDDSGTPILNEEEHGTLTNRMKSDGNFTAFFSTTPPPPIQQIYTLVETVEAQYIGLRYVNFKGQFIKTYFYCYTQADLHSIYRCEWYFDYDTGVLVRLVKSVEVNLIRVQWIEYSIKNTTLFLTGNHPVVAFFTNFRANFFAILGAVTMILFSFYYLIQKKAQRGEIT